MLLIAALVLVSGLAASPATQPPPQADDKALASELLALKETSARERWLQDHKAQITPALGREVAAQARAHYLGFRLDPAREGFEIALHLGEITGDAQSRILALEGLGGVERFRGHAREALPFLDRAMTESEAAADQRAAGRLLGSIGLARRMLGEYGAAVTLHTRQLAVFDALGDAEWRGWSEINLGTDLGALGRYTEAIPHFEQSLERFQAAGLPQAEASAYNNLGICYRDLGNYGAALNALNQSLELQQGGGKALSAATLHSIGELYGAQGVPLRALDYFRRGYAAALELGQKPYMANNLGDEGVTLIELRRPVEGRAALEKALALAEETHDPSTITWLSTALAQVHWDLGERERAFQLLQSGLEVAERTQQVPNVVSTERRIARLRLEEGQTTKARDLAGHAAELARRYELREELWPALLVMGRADRAIGRAEAAETALREAVDVVEDLRAHAVGPDADRAAFLIPHAAPYQELVSLLVDAGRGWDALNVAERSKGRVLLDVLAGGRMAIGPALSEKEKAEERRLEADLRTVNSETRDFLQRGEGEATRQKELLSRRAARRLELEDWRARQYAAHPNLRVLRGESRPIASSDVGELVSDGRTVLLEYALTESHAYLFVLSASPSSAPSLAVHRLTMKSAEIIRLARDLRARLAGRDLQFAEKAAALYQALVSPARTALRGAHRLVIAPDGPLWDLPFQALRSPSGRFLIEDVAVSYVPSLSVLRDMRTQAWSTHRPTGDLLAIGNPELGANARRGDSDPAATGLQNLPALEDQVREIATLYDPKATSVRVGSGARESWFKAEAPRYRVLHLATHAVLDDASPLYSELVLAAPTAGERDDGLLEAREIMDLDLGAELTVLSACETGRGRSGAGEGLIGMTWAFFVAGCPTTVASQWKVEAASTSRLMLTLHRELRAGKAPAEALRLAALAQLQRADQKHPFYWAGFVAMGDAYSSASSAVRPPTR
jgi:CHAT domain-containing protein/tetratricopeptide (TPR) repeat protein